MKHRRRVFHKQRQRRTPWRLLFLSLATVFASAPAAVPKTPADHAACVVHAASPAPAGERV